jgi:hypothetical protein
MNQNIRNNPVHHEAMRLQNETPQQMVNRIVQQVLEQLKDMPEVMNIIRQVLEKLQSIEKNLDGPLTHAYLEQLTVHNRVYSLIGIDAATMATIAANDKKFQMAA